jgi:hypothetical protein
MRDRDHPGSMGVSTGGAAAGRPPLGLLLLAGLAGAAVFEFIALVLAPAVLGHPIMPARLVANLGAVLTGVEWPMLAGWIGHLAAGIVVFPLGYLALLRLSGLRPWLAGGAIWGVVLWLLAQGVFGPAAGGPFMSGFSSFMFVSLAVHLAYAVAVALALHLVLARRGRG